MLALPLQCSSIFLALLSIAVYDVSLYLPDSMSAVPVAAVLSSQVSGDSSSILSRHPAILEFQVNMDMEEIVRIVVGTY